MKTHVEVELNFGAPWHSAELTDERGYGHPVIVVDGEHQVRGTAEVMFIRPQTGTDRSMLDAARSAGYTVLDDQSD